MVKRGDKPAGNRMPVLLFTWPPGSTCRVAGLIVAAVLLLAGCSSGSHLQRQYIGSAPPPQPDMRVLIVPFQNYTAHPGAGGYIARLAATELYKERLFVIQELSSGGASQSGGNRRIGDPVAAARAAGADAVLSGSVMEYGYRYGLRKQAVVGITMRLTRTDGAVLWAVSTSRTGSVYLGRDSASRVAQQAVMSTVQSLSRQMGESSP